MEKDKSLCNTLFIYYYIFIYACIYLYVYQMAEKHINLLVALRNLV